MEYVAIALGALSSALGGITLWVLSGLRSDIAEIRQQTQQNSQNIAHLQGRFGERL